MLYKKIDEKIYGNKKDANYSKLIEELKKAGAYKNEMFEKQKIAKEEFDRLKGIYNDVVC